MTQGMIKGLFKSKKVVMTASNQAISIAQRRQYQSTHTAGLLTRVHANIKALSSMLQQMGSSADVQDWDFVRQVAGQVQQWVQVGHQAGQRPAVVLQHANRPPTAACLVDRSSGPHRCTLPLPWIALQNQLITHLTGAGLISGMQLEPLGLLMELQEAASSVTGHNRSGELLPELIQVQIRETWQRDVQQLKEAGSEWSYLAPAYPAVQLGSTGQTAMTTYPFLYCSGSVRHNERAGGQHARAGPAVAV